MAFGEAAKRHPEPSFQTAAEQLIAEARANIAPGAVMSWARRSGLYNLITERHPSEGAKVPA